MRRSFLILTAISFSVWSQPAQQATPPPIVVQVQMPPTNPWMHLVELVVPGIIGAGLALFGVWLTNKHNAATNAANRQHQVDVERVKDEIAAQAKSRDNRWEFRKTVYVNLVNSLTDLITCYGVVYLGAKGTKETPDISQETNERLKRSLDQFLIHVNLAPLATAERVHHLIQTQLPRFFEMGETDSATIEHYENLVSVLVEMRKDLCTEGCKDLWGTPGPGSEG